MNERLLLTFIIIPARTDAAGHYEERETAIARWCRPTIREKIGGSSALSNRPTERESNKDEMPSPPT